MFATIQTMMMNKTERGNAMKVRLTAETVEGEMMVVGDFDSKYKVQSWLKENAAWVSEWRGYTVTPTPN